MTESDRRFLERAVARKGIYLRLSIAGIAVAAGLAGWYLWSWISARNSTAHTLTGFVIVTLVLLNARQNLRQFRYGRILEKLTTGRE